MSTTPITDKAQQSITTGHGQSDYYVPVEVAREFELSNARLRAALEIAMAADKNAMAELAKLREDKARLDWLEKPGAWPSFMHSVDVLSGKVDGKTLPGWTWRQALDHARGNGRF